MSARSESRASARPSASVERLANEVLLPGFVGPACPGWLSDALSDGLGGVCLFGSNIDSPAQLAVLTAALRAAGTDPVIAIDEEGGDVSRLHVAAGSPAAGNAYLGRIDDPALTALSYAAIGHELAALGVTMNLAPVADINSNPRNPVIGVRSFGAGSTLVARHVAAAVVGLQTAGAGAVTKHFPGHGDTAIDSHVGMPVLDIDLATLRQRELIPFVAAIGAGTAAVMTAHLMVPALDPIRPASLSAATTRLLRDELGFDGLVVTDALDMAGASGDGRGIPEAAVLALVAGAQLLCLGTASTPELLSAIRGAVVTAVASGRLPRPVLEDAAAAVRRYRSRFPGGRGATRADHPKVGIRGLTVRRPVAAQQHPLVLRLTGSFNHAAGDVPWGLGAHLAAELETLLPGTRTVQIHDPAELDTALIDAGDVVVLGRNIGRAGLQSRTVARIRELRPAAVVVEMGWPADDDDWDIASHGAGRAVSLALGRLLAEGAR